MILGEAASNSFVGICRRPAASLSGYYYGIGHERLANSSPLTRSETRVDQSRRGGRTRRPQELVLKRQTRSSKLIWPHCAVCRMAIIDRLARLHGTLGKGMAASGGLQRMR